MRRRFKIDEGPRIAFLEEEGRLFVQPVTDEFIDAASLQGGLPERVELKPRPGTVMKGYVLNAMPSTAFSLVAPELIL
jgi:hypothetical protein